MDRLLAMLMKFYFIEPEDTFIGLSGLGNRRVPPISRSPMLPPATPKTREVERGYEPGYRKKQGCAAAAGEGDGDSAVTSPSPTASVFWKDHAESGTVVGAAATTGAAAAVARAVASDEASPSATPALSGRPRNGCRLEAGNSTSDTGIDTGPGNVHDRGPNPTESAEVAASRRGGGGGHGGGEELLVPFPSRSPASTGSIAVSPSREEQENSTILLGQKVFTVFAGLFEGFRLHHLYAPERGGVLVCTEVLLELTKKRLPELARHFDEIDFSLDMVRNT